VTVADPRFGEHLEQLWDAVRRGNADAATSDPALAETLRRMHALDHVPAPDPAFIRQVRQELLTTATPPNVVDAHPARSPNGRALADPWRAWQPIRPTTPERGGWAMAQVATALLLVLTLVAAYLAFGPGQLRPTVLPAVEGTQPVAQETGVTVTPLGSGTADALPDEPSWLMTFHSTFRPGGRFGVEPSEGPDLVAVTSGTLTYHADQPLTVTRAASGDGQGAPEVVPAGTDAVLSAGDSLLIPLGANVSRRNDGTEPAVEVMAMLEGTFLGTAGRSGSSSVVDQPIVTFHISDAHTLPPAPVTITLSRVVLAPHARFTPPSASWWMVGTPEEAYPNLEQQPDGAAVNTSSDPIELYLTTVASVSGGTAVP
jgi:hypothetical protein